MDREGGWSRSGWRVNVINEGTYSYPDMDWEEVEIIYLISLLECNNVIIE